MRIRKRKNLKRKNSAIVGLFLIPLIGMGAYLGFGVYILYDLASFTLDLKPPDTDNFTELDDINKTILREMADHFDTQMEQYHMSTNITVDVTYTDYNYNEVKTHQGTDNGNLHLGYTLAANCHRLQWAIDNDDDILIENASRMIRKCVSGFSDFMAAPNGGLGPDYPGTLARFVCAPENRNIHPWMFEDHYKHFNGTGDYKNWRVRLYTSRDEFAGFYLGMASVLKFVDPDTNDDCEWAYERVQLLVEQLIEGLRKSNWLVLHGDGTPCGSDLNPVFEGSTWQLTLLRIGATALPEKYESLYQYCAAKMLSIGNAKMGDVMNAAGDTYSLSFGVCVMYSLIILEDNPKLLYHYIKNYETGFYSFTKYHRNNWYNIAHLIFMELLDEIDKDRKQFENEDYNDKNVKWDVLDQLWRYKTSGWSEGVRNYNLTDRPHSTRETSLDPDIAKMERTPSMKKWREFFENDPIGRLYAWIWEEGFWDFDEEDEQYLLPITVSEYGIHHWVWEHSKFSSEGGNPTGNGLTEAAPNSYVCIYWMGRAFDIF